MTTPGQNVWFDLMTPDVDRAKAFYTEALGWKIEDWAGADPSMPYSMWKVGDSAIGGVMRLPDEAKEMGAPPHWLGYTTVVDADATAAKVTELGGKILRPGFDIPNVGRIAVLADPQGAPFAVIQAAGEMSGTKGDLHGEFSGAELNTTDWEGGWKFYEALFGWKVRSTMDMGPAGTYHMFEDAEKVTKGGMSNAAAMMKIPPHWLHYVTVDDLDACLERVKSGGGKVFNGPMDIPGGDRIAQCMDPQGAAFAVYEEGKRD